MPPTSNTTQRQAWCGCTVTASTRLCTNCEECGDCCQCKECSQCNRKFYPDDFCDHCNRCFEHCACEVCESCQSRHSSDDHAICHNCYRCLANCCECYRCKECRTKSKPEDHCNRCGKCPTHCKCYMCVECNVRQKVSNFCTLCNKCNEHCKCPICVQCGKKYREGDKCEDGCGKCERCCRCRITGVEFRRGAFKMYDGVFAKGEFKVNRLTRHIAAEIEVDRFSSSKNSRLLNEALDRWGDAVVQDGSISGFEINTNPCNGDLWLKHIGELCTGFQKIDAKCSTACGLHVHVNAKDLQFYDLRKLIMLYHKIEPAFFSLCQPQRINGHYSQVCGAFFMTKQQNPEQFRKELTQKLYSGVRCPTVNKKGKNAGLAEYGRQLKQRKSHKYEGIRYKALNLHSYFLRGSIEFRHKEGTTDFDEITNWGMLCANVIDAANKLTEKQILSLPGGAQSDKKVIEVTKDTSQEALMAILPQNLRDYAERKWSANGIALSARWKAELEERWRNIAPFRG